jgi:16S rRNA (guanine527-N7)-methyltransferase
MDPTRIAELLAPFLTAPLSSLQLNQISTYIDLLLRWNARTNLTAVRTPDEVVTRHFGESLFAAQALYPTSNHVGAGALTRPEERSSSTLFDLGSGAGFPGLPIHLWAPQLHTTLIESQHKKVAFLREVIRTLTLTNINALSARAEDLTTTASTVTLRAVERFDAVLPSASDLVAPAGRLALLIAEPQIVRAQAALPAFTWEPAVPIPHSSARVLLVGIRPHSA